MEIGYLKTKSALVLWNVRQMLHDIEENYHKYEVRMMPVVDLVGQCLPAFPEDEDCDISVFPIVLSLARDKYRVVSGEAQVNKAQALGFWDIDCYFVKPGQHKKYIIDYDEQVYRRAVNEFLAYEER